MNFILDSVQWDTNLAYALGLLVTDGNLSKDGRHLNLTSKDLDQIMTFKKILKLTNNISLKARAREKEKRYYFLQFGNVRLYRFCLSIGITPNKSKTIGKVDIPDIYFFDFLRGHFDGDGTFYSYMDKRWKNSFLFYLVFMSASPSHIEWLRLSINRLTGCSGHISKSCNSSVFQLRYSKKEAVIILNRMYYQPGLASLKRKRLKVKDALGIIGENLFYARVL